MKMAHRIWPIAYGDTSDRPCDEDTRLPDLLFRLGLLTALSDLSTARFAGIPSPRMARGNTVIFFGQHYKSFHLGLSKSLGL